MNGCLSTEANSRASRPLCSSWHIPLLLLTCPLLFPSPLSAGEGMIRPATSDHRENSAASRPSYSLIRPESSERDECGSAVPAAYRAGINRRWDRLCAGPVASDNCGTESVVIRWWRGQELNYLGRNRRLSAILLRPMTHQWSLDGIAATATPSSENAPEQISKKNTSAADAAATASRVRLVSFLESVTDENETAGEGGYDFPDIPLDETEYREPETVVDQTQPRPTPDLSPLFTSQPDWYGRSSPVRVRFHAGESYAEPSSFVSFNLLRPLQNWKFQSGSEQISYADVRVGLNVDGGGLANIGVGRRHYFASDDTIVDANIWYDIDGTRDRLFHQITAGGQVQNQNLLLRGHYYLPISDTEKAVDYTALTGNYKYQGNILALERFRRESQAYHGFDTEIGIMLPLRRIMASWFVGYYNFKAEDAQAIDGISTTLGVTVLKNLSLSFQVNYDDESDAGYLLTASYDFYNGPADPAPNIRHRLGETVRRNYHILSRRARIYDPVTATNTSGNPFNFIHVSSLGNSNGTIESPYGNLADAQNAAAATPESIILAHADSIFDGQQISLPAKTQFLGEGVAHTVTTAELGDLTLPAAGGGTALPVIRNSPGSAITLGAETMVNGVRIENATTAGLFGDSLTAGANIANTTIDGGATGVHLRDSTGIFTFDTLSVANTTGSSIHIERAGTGAAITFNNTTAVSNAGLYGIHLNRNQSGSAVTFAGTTSVSNTANHGIFLDDNADTAATTFSSATSVDTTGGSGVFISNLDSGTTSTANNVQFSDTLSVNNTSQSGVVANLNDSNVLIQTLVISDWDQSAIVIDGSSGDFTVVSPISLNNTNGAPDSTIQIANSSAAVTFSDVTVTDTVRAPGGAPTVSLFQNNTGVDEITFNGLNIDSRNGVALRAQDSGPGNSKLVIRGGQISATGGPAVWLNEISTDVTLQSVTVSNAPVGIQLVNVGQNSAFHRKFQIVGDSNTPGSGGLLTNVQRGVVVDGSEDVSLQFMTIDSTVKGIDVLSNAANQPENLSLSNLVLTDGGNSANWVGIDVNWSNGAHFGDSNVFRNNVITGGGTGQTGLRIVNNASNPQMEVTIGGNTINLTGGSSNGISLTAIGFIPGQTTNLGGINLTTDLNNIVNAVASPFVSSQSNGATIVGQTLVNGVLVP